MRNLLCLAVVSLAFAVPAGFPEREPEARRRGGDWRQRAEAGPQGLAVLPVTAINGSSLVYATRGGFFATGVRFARAAPDALATWTVEWPAAVDRTVR